MSRPKGGEGAYNLRDPHGNGIRYFHNTWCPSRDPMISN